jgi:hypothetical protein
MEKKLKAITNRDSGIIIHSDRVLISFTWGNDEGLPMLSPLNIPMLTPLYEFELIGTANVDDCLEVLPETNEAYISEEEFNDLKGQEGEVFTLKTNTGYTFKVLHPVTWR